MMGKARKLLGIDIGSDEVKIVELQSAGPMLTITNYAQGQLTEGADAADLVRDLLRSHGFKTKRCVTAVSGRSVIVRYVSMAQQPDETLHKNVRQEADKYIPFDINEVQMDCQRIEEENAVGNEVKVLLVAVKRDLLDEHVAMLKRMGLTSHVIDVDAFALGNSFETVNNLSAAPVTDKVIALLDISATKSNVNIVKGKTSYFTREVYLGGRDMTDAIAKSMSIDFADAESLKRNPAERIEELKEYMAPVFDDLANEVRLCFDYFENQFEHTVDEVFLSGGAAKQVQITDILGPVLERPVNLWSPIENMQVDAGSVDINKLKQNAPQLTIAMGLASRILG